MDPQPIWTRLEPHARDRQLTPGLDATIHDPLWLLARQWQLLEFWGEDAGSPIMAQVEMTCAPITRYFSTRKRQPSSPLNITGQAFDGTVPLETLVERERVRRTEGPISQVRLAAEAGLHFLRLLDMNGVGTLRANVIRDFPLQPLTVDQSTSVDQDTARFMHVMAGRVPDGTLLRAGIPSWTGFSQDQKEAVWKTFKKWLAWYDMLFYEPPGLEESSWDPQRLEYHALISASTPKGEVVLNASEYADGHLDWYSFGVLSAGSLGAKESDTTSIQNKYLTMNVIPTPATFHGMPASRYWEFEDANVDFGGIAAGEQQLAHVLLIEFGLVSGDDWFVIPVELPVGALCFTNKLLVHDTFGWTPTLIKSARTVDADSKRPTGLLPWDLFRLSPDQQQGIGIGNVGPDALFLPPTLGKSLQGKAIEEVLFARDEMANMAWAIERTVESAIGRPLRRSEAHFRSRPEQPKASAGPEATLRRRYRLASEVPPHWVPMLPVPTKRGEVAKLGFKVRGQGKGLVLTELRSTGSQDMPLYGEEVPREGVRISRAFQYTRWTNGRSYLWVGRRNEVGRGESSSGLAFDQLVPQDERSNP
mgnify:CR=1 FL=1